VICFIAEIGKSRCKNRITRARKNSTIFQRTQKENIKTYQLGRNVGGMLADPLLAYMIAATVTSNSDLHIYDQQN